METLKAKGKIAAYGVSVEKIDEAMEALRHPGVASVQIIYNLFRQRPADAFFAAAKAADVAVIARVPLASGLLTGKMSATSTFAPDDHRSFNRNGEAFDKGETFSGVPYDVALQAVEELRALVPANTTMAAFALRWILMQDAVSVVIPGAKSPPQAQANVLANALPDLQTSTLAAARDIYTRLIAPHVAHLW
jgi:aryl-alcohol dehydrogenase-like predicted oxidoreductase